MVVEAAESGMRSSPAAPGPDIALHGHRLSTVVPASVTGEAVNYELADADLLHKLHYVRAVHVFRATAPATGGGGGGALTVRALKEPMFQWLDMYFPVSGRLRRHGDDAVVVSDGDGAAAAGRPYVRCNDCGVRVVEAACDITVDEWLEEEAARGGRARMLSYDKVIGPELFFSPLLYVQITSFKCGGMAVGFTWAHLIGDIPSAAACFSTWAQLVSGKKPTAPVLRGPIAAPPSTPPVGATAPPSVKATAAPVGDHWAVPATRDMAPLSFDVTEQQLDGLQLGAPAGHSHVGAFELVAALMWRALAAVRGAGEETTRTVTIVKAGAASAQGGCGGGTGLSNEHRIGHVVVAGGSPAVAERGVAELAALLAGARLDDAGAAAAWVAAAGADAVVYGANLTFVDAGEVNVYGGLELAGRRPAHVEYAVDGVGDGGAAVVHRDAGGRGRTVAAVVRRGEADRLRAALRDALRVAV